MYLPHPPNHTIYKGLLAMLCLIFALSARIAVMEGLLLWQHECKSLCTRPGNAVFGDQLILVLVTQCRHPL
jgi:hypothetical protein